MHFFEGTDATGTLLGTEATGVALLPGQSTTVEVEVDAPVDPTDFFVDVDIEGDLIEECVEDNNDSVALDVQCPVIG